MCGQNINPPFYANDCGNDCAHDCGDDCANNCGDDCAIDNESGRHLPAVAVFLNSFCIYDYFLLAMCV